MNKPLEQMSMGERVRMVREEKKLSILELAAFAGIARTTLSCIENNRGSGSIWSLVEIARALDTSLDFLTGLSNNR